MLYYIRGYSPVLTAISLSSIKVVLNKLLHHLFYLCIVHNLCKNKQFFYFCR
ncbi:hypothetical protein MBAV_005117 [Candidatus Magnetobacterium bavaricum]|uniref:Uncharacterized protein n=1 Tax=Candidatus Magnetobacterium bavaricum TaxID=29290 RepID=A0A0F3GLB8_9BACT|nr:hypothetical protein MBAV_005117 [Candidatus Magnetobacterium bavaricum]